MQKHYIKAPLAPLSVTIHKGKVPKIKPAKRSEVPEFYRKGRQKKTHLTIADIPLYIIGFIEFIRKEMTTWTSLRKTRKSYKKD